MGGEERRAVGETISLPRSLCAGDKKPSSNRSHLNWLPPQDEEVLRSHHHETHELVAKDLLNFISLVQTDVFTVTQLAKPPPFKNIHTFFF